MKILTMINFFATKGPITIEMFKEEEDIKLKSKIEQLDNRNQGLLFVALNDLINNDIGNFHCGAFFNFYYGPSEKSKQELSYALVCRLLNPYNSEDLYKGYNGKPESNEYKILQKLNSQPNNYTHDLLEMLDFSEQKLDFFFFDMLIKNELIEQDSNHPVYDD